MGVPRYHKLSFPTYDGKDDPLGWLNRCKHFFRAQRTQNTDKVWRASFHMTGTAQHWLYMLERDTGDLSAITWDGFRSLCHQHFGPPLGINHLAELARLPFRGSVNDYLEAFQSRMAHVGHLTPLQQVQLFTGGLLDPIRTDVEVQAPLDLQRAMYMARAYERRSASLQPPALTRLPRTPFPPTTKPNHLINHSSHSIIARPPIPQDLSAALLQPRWRIAAGKACAKLR